MHASCRGGYKQLYHPYYMVNILLSVVFVISKKMPYVCSTLYDSCVIDFEEYELLICLVAFVTMRNKRQFNITDYVAHFCMFAKLCNLFMFYGQGVTYATIYAVLWLLQACFLFQPVYSGPEAVYYFRDNTFEEVVINGDHRVIWVICFYTAWSPSCNTLAPVFSELSNSYTLGNLRFGKVDVARSAAIARSCGIDNSTWSKQLPSIILFKGGKEYDRRPGLSLKTKKPVKFNFSWDSIVSSFCLNDLYSQCKAQDSHIQRSAKKEEIEKKNK